MDHALSYKEAWRVGTVARAARRCELRGAGREVPLPDGSAKISLVNID